MKLKSVILSLLLGLYVKVISCNDDILSKFHQNVFHMRDVRVELKSFNEKYFNKFQLKTFKYNRTTPAMNCSMNMKVTINDKAEVLVQSFKFLSNEYRRFPIRFQVNIKKAFDANVMGIKAVGRCGNITTFIFEKDITYYACNFVIDYTHLPPLIPNGKYRTDAKVLYLNEEIALIYLFGEIYTPTAYPKK